MGSKQQTNIIAQAEATLRALTAKRNALTERAGALAE